MDSAVMAPTFAKRTLNAGFTTVRNVGAPGYIDVALRNAINRGLIQGPRMLVATLAIGATGGHFDHSDGFRDGLFGRQMDYTDGIADGPEEIRKAVRYEVKNGADVIKAAVSGGVLYLPRAGDVPPVTAGEMKALGERTIVMHPIAGTRPRGADPAADAVNEAELRASEKERAEHVRLGDLGRHDVGRGPTPGPARVPALRRGDRCSHRSAPTAAGAGAQLAGVVLIDGPGPLPLCRDNGHLVPCR